jgi:cytochrome c-type biogenesis protein
MMKSLIYLQTLLIALLFLAGCNTSGSEPENMTDVRPAPDFTYTSLDNEEYTLSDLRGKVVYIFFFGANCTHCRDNAPVTQNQIFEGFQENDDFIALGLETWNTNASSLSFFQNLTGLEYPLLLKAQQSLVDYYGNTTSYDRSVVINKEGLIIYQGTEFVDKDVDQVVKIIDKELKKN